MPKKGHFPQNPEKVGIWRSRTPARAGVLHQPLAAGPRGSRRVSPEASDATKRGVSPGRPGPRGCISGDSGHRRFTHSLSLFLRGVPPRLAIHLYPTRSGLLRPPRGGRPLPGRRGVPPPTPSGGLPPRFRRGVREGAPGALPGESGQEASPEARIPVPGTPDHGPPAGYRGAPARGVDVKPLAPGPWDRSRGSPGAGFPAPWPGGRSRTRSGRPSGTPVPGTPVPGGSGRPF